MGVSHRNSSHHFVHNLVHYTPTNFSPVPQMHSGRNPGYIPRVYLNGNNNPTITHVDLQDRNLHGPTGGREVVGLLKKRPSVTAITLNQNELGDDGLSIVLQYLTYNSTSLGITTLSLNCCNLGDSSLEGLGEYIRNHRTLQNLSLQNNTFKGDPHIVTHFTQCLNSSSISKLDLGRNPQAGDTFVATMLSHLNASQLDHLNLAAMNLTPASQEAILSYLSSPASRPLRFFGCGGNRLTRPFADALIHGLWTGNYWLKYVELHGNLLNSMSLPEETRPEACPSSPADSAEARMKPWPACQKDMDYALHRNRLAGDFAGDGAVRLLPCARVVVQQLGAGNAHAALPFELKALILNELAPSLSLKQCHRIVHYAAQGFRNAAKTRQSFLKAVQCDVFEPNSLDDVLRALNNINTGRLTLVHGTGLPSLATFG